MRPLRNLAKDIERNLKLAVEETKKRLAQQVLQDSESRAPKDTGFLAQQGKVYVNGKLFGQTGSAQAGYRKVAIPPEGGYTADVTLVYRAGRHSHLSGQVFDYSYYVGVVDPDWLRFAETKHWIEMALNPDVANTVLAQTLQEFMRA